MNIYIDKANLISFIKANSNEFYGDCLKLLKKQLNIYFNFPKEDLKNDPLLMNWYTTLTHGVGLYNSFSFNFSFPERPLKSNTYKNFDADQLSSVYLVDDERCEALKNTGAILIGNVGEEIDTITKLFLSQKDYLFEKKWRIGGDDFKCWNDLEPYSLPLSDIIILDQYILKNKDSDDDTLDSNLIKYLYVLTKHVFTKVNIVIVTHPDHIDYDFEAVKTKIAHIVKQSTNVKPHITLIKTSKEHDRAILTNYKRIYSGDTFNYWNAKGIKITKGKEIHYSSMATLENHELAKSFINDIQKILISNEKNNPSYIEGDKISGYLKFNQVCTTTAHI